MGSLENSNQTKEEADRGENGLTTSLIELEDSNIGTKLRHMVGVGDQAHLPYDHIRSGHGLMMIMMTIYFSNNLYASKKSFDFPKWHTIDDYNCFVF